MQLTRRDFLKTGSAVAGALALSKFGFWGLERALAAEGAGKPIVWVQAQACTGCSVSFLNSVYYQSVDTLLTQSLDLDFHPNITPAVGQQAINAVKATMAKGNYVLVVEGAIPTGASGDYCTFWPGMTALDGLKLLAANAAAVIAVGTCASFGGIPAAKPNPTGAVPVSQVVTNKPLINIPGCPVHPDWIVGTVAYIFKNNAIPRLDQYKRPLDYFANTVHSKCPNRHRDGGGIGKAGCLEDYGCRGPAARADCPIRKWNSGAANTYGVNWCIGARVPCNGCTEATFPDGMSPFFRNDD